MLKTWCALLTQDTVDILPPPLCSEEECHPKRLMSKCSTFKTKTLHTLLSGSQITSNPLSAISHQRVSKCLLHSLVTLLLSKRCSRESPNNSLLCSEERLSSIGIPERVWMRWNSPKLNPTWTILFPNINNIKMLLLKKKENLMKKKKMKKECDSIFRIIWMEYINFFFIFYFRFLSK